MGSKGINLVHFHYIFWLNIKIIHTKIYLLLTKKASKFRASAQYGLIPSSEFHPCLQPESCWFPPAPGSQPPPAAERCPGMLRSPRGIRIMLLKAQTAVARIHTKKEFL